jgi:type III secretion protein T
MHALALQSETLLLPLLALAILMPRWLGVMHLVPLFSTPALPSLMRNVVALALSLPLLPAMLAQLRTQLPDCGTLILLGLKESMLGLLLGCLLAIPFWIFEAAAVYLDNQRGANVQAVNPSASADASELGLALQQALIVMLLHAGLFGVLLAPVYQSYRAWPPWAPLPPLDQAMLERLLPLFTHLMTASLIVASPGLICLGLVETAFALLSRWNPQLPAYIAALPVKSLVALLVVVLCLPVYWRVGREELEAKPRQIRTLFALPAATGSRSGLETGSASGSGISLETASESGSGSHVETGSEPSPALSPAAEPR